MVRLLLVSWMLAMASCATQPAMALPNDHVYQQGQDAIDEMCYQQAVKLYVILTKDKHWGMNAAIIESRKLYRQCMVDMTRIL